MRGWVAILAVAGCGFEHGQLGMNASDSGIAGDGNAEDGASESDAAIDAPPPPTCLVTDPSLVWCLEFDEPGLANATTAKDGSGKNHPPSIANFGVTSRNVPTTSQAIALTTTSSVTIPKPTDFNLQEFTITAWIYRTSSNELGVLDTAFQYTLTIESPGHTVACAIANTQGTGIVYYNSSQTTINEWDLVACTYDGSQACTYSFRNGSSSSQMGCASRSSTTATNGNTTTVGTWADGTTHFIGALDQVRLYSRALSKQEICVAAGLTGC